MRSSTLAFVSALLLSPISVLATYGEHGHHPDHPHHSNEAEHAVSKMSDHSPTKIARIAITMDLFMSDVKYICNRLEETCLENHECDEKYKSCRRKNKCPEKKKKCFKEFKCDKESEVCHEETTNRYGFRCGKKFYNQAKTLAAAMAACKKIGKNSQKSAFPAAHTFYKFDKPGPYVEWPINKNGGIFPSIHRSKKHRIVMTMDCGVVGAVIRHKNGDYSKCKYKRH